MPEFKSPIGNKQFTSQPMKDLEIPDESGYSPPTHPQPHGHQHNQANYMVDEATLREFNARMNPVPTPMASREVSEMEREIQEARKARRLGLERPTDGAKKRIEMLLGMTRISKSVVIDGNQYILQTLKSRELRDAITAAAEFNGTVQFAFETRKQLLGRSLVQVAGVPIETFLNSNELEPRLELIEDMDHSLAMRLYNEYVILAQESESKYALKTDTDLKEVAEDLKK